jgi:hypothetical protein
MAATHYHQTAEHAERQCDPRHSGHPLMLSSSEARAAKRNA